MSRRCAPDGKPWPLPRVAVDHGEQRPLTFGYVPLPWVKVGERGPTHNGVTDPESLVVQNLGGPWYSERGDLQHEGDYQLLGPDGSRLPKAEGIVVETKRGDLISSLLAGHDPLLREMERLGAYRRAYFIATTSYSAMLATPRAAGRELSLLGTLESLAMDHGVQVRMVDDDPREDGGAPGRHAEYVVAWVLRRAWRWYLTQHPEVLAECRRIEAVEASHARPAPVAAPAASRPALAYDPGPGDPRRRKADAKRAHERGA